MEEIQEQQNLANEPVNTDNSAAQIQSEGQAQDAPSDLILGKFKSIDELSKAYEQLEKRQGIQSQELGELRHNSALINNIRKAWEEESKIRVAQNELMEAAKKYNSPEYFQDPSFREIYREAFLALGKNLDTDRFINLLEGYVSSRLFAQEKSRAAQSENEKAIESMTFSKNPNSSITPPKKRLDEMTPKEIDDLLERII